MLTSIQTANLSAKGVRFAIVASEYNARFVDGMLNAARETLGAAGAESVRVVRVPGAFEIPTVVSALLRSVGPPYHAIITLGLILRGQTTHADYIGRTVTEALMRLQVDSRVPVIHEVLLVESEEQAVARCLDPAHNRGAEAAQTALKMASVMRSLNVVGE